ncbi:MAG: glycerophosphodiester phosphodiesterase family protein, partial [Bacilli bacterium]
MKKLNFLKEKLVAHRGYHDITIGIAENSLNSFRRAVKNNYLIELDVHLLKDKSLVVFHDDNLKRACGVDKEIDSCTYAEIKNLTLFNTSSKIPLLKEVFDEVKGRVPILIETKGNNKYGELEEILLREIKAYSGLTAVQSFNPKS